MADVKDKKMLIELSVQEDHFEFASSIDTALLSAKNEYNELNKQIQESLEKIQKLTPECDKLDYVLSVTCGALCGVIDVFLVGKPGRVSGWKHYR